MDLPTLPLEHAGWIFAVLMAIVLFVPILAERVRIPAIVGLILAGTVVGPHVVGMVEREGLMAVLGSVGLLYLMFVAGLELDLDEFAARRADSIAFGTLTFVVPMLVGTIAFAAIGFDLLAAILIASAFASHTLVAYPVFRRYGTATQRSVSTSVGATILTDTAALIVLVVVARAYGGVLDTTFWVVLAASLGLLLGAILWGVPILTRWFFSGIGQQRHARFLFVMVVLFAASAAAEVAGIEAIIGAFLAGLALNRQVPAGSILMERIEFLGSSFLIPIFLVSVGMLIDPAVLLSVATLGVAAAFVAVALGTKLAAAGIAGALFGYDRVEIAAMASLSSAQAAATLAAVIVGLEVGLIDTATMNAVVVVILVTCLASSWLADRCAPRLERPPPKHLLGTRVIVPVARPETASALGGLAAAIARRDSGIVVPVTVVAAGAARDEIEAARLVNDDAEQAARAYGVETHAVTRIDASATTGVLHTVVEHAGSMLVLGWKGHSDRREALLGGILDSIVEASPVPVVVARLHERPYERVLLAVSDSLVDPVGRASLRLGLETARRVARDAGIPVAALSNTEDRAVRALVEQQLGVTMEVADGRRADLLRAHARDGDLLVVPVRSGRSGLRRAANRIARAVPDHAIVFAISHGTEVTLAPASQSLDDPLEVEARTTRGPRPGGGEAPNLVSVGGG